MNKSSADLIATNQDMLMEILLHVPIKPLYTFKSVSKHFLNLISSPYFCKKHTLKNTTLKSPGLIMYQNPSLIYLSLETENPNSQPSFGPVPVLDFFKITPCNNNTNLTILSSCNGLLLCLLVLPTWNINTDNIVYIVLNPSTKKSITLPPLQNLAKNPIVNMDLAYDPKLSIHYKVICMRHSSPPDGPHFVIEIFSSESGLWRSCQVFDFEIHPGIGFQGGIYWNNGIYYMNQYSENSCYFRIEDETMKTLSMPSMQGEMRLRYMGQSGGHLHLVDIERNTYMIDIYEVMDDCKGWVLKLRLDLGVIIGLIDTEMVKYIGRCYMCSVLSVIQKDGDEDFLEIILSIPHKIICYNPRDHKSKVLVYFGDDKDRLRFEWKNVIQYTETLLPV